MFLIVNRRETKGLRAVQRVSSVLLLLLFLEDDVVFG